MDYLKVLSCDLNDLFEDDKTVLQLIGRWHLAFIVTNKSKCGRIGDSSFELNRPCNLEKGV